MKEAAVGVVFSDDKHSILLVKRRDVPVWVLPGGGIDLDESPTFAVCREILEETGFRVTIARQVAIYTPLNRLSAKTYLFECQIQSGSATTTDETQDIRFFRLDLLPRNLFIVHRDWLEDVLANNPAVIEKTINRVTYWNVLKYLVRHPLHIFRYLLSRCGFAINSK